MKTIAGWVALAGVGIGCASGQVLTATPAIVTTSSAASGPEHSETLSAEALRQLAWDHDPAGVGACTAALGSPSLEVRAAAAAGLAEYGPALAAPARPAVLAAFNDASGALKAQLAWTLVVLREPLVFAQAVTLYRQGELAKVERLDGGPAFDASRFAGIASLDKLAVLAHDDSAAVRQLVAAVLSEHAEAHWQDLLLGLLADQDRDVSVAAAPGVARLSDVRARQHLLDALKLADKDARQAYLQALRDAGGTEALLLALGAAPGDDEKTAWYMTKQVFDLIHSPSEGNAGLDDPHGADALVAFIASKPHIHFQTRAAFALAALGDTRAVPALAARLRLDPLKIYSDRNDWEMMLKRDDGERVAAARMLADLAELHPEARPLIAKQSEDALVFWLQSSPSPHANGMRALAAMRSAKAAPLLRKWSKPQSPLAKEGQQPPMPEDWVLAQSALRYLGVIQDEPSHAVLEKMLKLRPSGLDVTMDGLMQGGIAILGMSLRAVGVGAAEGFSEWRDPRAFKPLLAHIEDPL
ncbi:MAG TPA: HEAT repeat domain-containing protein, partial [Polyangiaceae bacterium]|nr:HEAT repeat domain-containing protein [Polyangiaceae bacterium]